MTKKIIAAIIFSLTMSAAIASRADNTSGKCVVASKIKKNPSEPTTTKKASKKTLPATASATTYGDLVTIRGMEFHPEMAGTKAATVLPDISEVGLARRENQVRLVGVVKHNVYHVVAGETTDNTLVASDE